MTINQAISSLNSEKKNLKIKINEHWSMSNQAIESAISVELQIAKLNEYNGLKFIATTLNATAGGLRKIVKFHQTKITEGRELLQKVNVEIEGLWKHYKLLPCPKCNAKMRIYSVREWNMFKTPYDKGLFIVGCNIHTGGCGLNSGVEKDRIKLANQWNQRSVRLFEEEIIEFELNKIKKENAFGFHSVESKDKEADIILKGNKNCICPYCSVPVTDTNIGNHRKDCTHVI